MATGNNREISKESWKSSLSNNRDNSHFSSFFFVIEKDFEMTDFGAIKLYLLILKLLIMMEFIVWEWGRNVEEIVDAFI